MVVVVVVVEVVVAAVVVADYTATTLVITTSTSTATATTSPVAPHHYYATTHYCHQGYCDEAVTSVVTVFIPCVCGGGSCSGSRTGSSFLRPPAVPLTNYNDHC